MRFRPRFTIRDLFWLTLVAALIAGWVIEGRQLADAKRRLTEIDSKRMFVYKTSHTIHSAFLKAMQEAYSKDPSVRIAGDPEAGAVIIEAPNSAQDSIFIICRSSERTINAAPKTPAAN
jgi:hypothetical protein